MSGSEKPPIPTERAVQGDEVQDGGRRGPPLLVLAVVVTLVVLGAIGAVIAAPNTPTSSTPAQSPTRRVLHSAPSHHTLQAPFDLSAIGTADGSVALSWQQPAIAPIGYRIYRALGRVGPYTIVGSVDAPDITSFTDSMDPLPGATYAYTVTAFNRQEESQAADPVVVVLLPAITSTPAVNATIQPLPTFQAPHVPTLTALAHARVGSNTVNPGTVATSGAFATLPATIKSVAPTSPAAIATHGPGHTVFTATPTIPVPRSTVMAVATAVVANPILTPQATLRVPSAIPTIPAPHITPTMPVFGPTTTPPP